MAHRMDEGERLRLAVEILAAGLVSVATYLKQSPDMAAQDTAARVLQRIEALDKLAQEGTTRCR